MAFGINLEDQKKKNIIVYDLGGGTLDVTIMSIEESIYDVLATDGDTHLGGADFDNKLVNFCVEQFKTENGIDVRGNERAMHRVRTSCESAKRMLSSTTETPIDIEELAQGKDFTYRLTRAFFEDLCSDLFNRSMQCVERCMEAAKVGTKDIDEIVLVGGSTRIPKVPLMLTKYFEGKPPNKQVNPDEAVAVGAAIQGAILAGETGERL